MTMTDIPGGGFYFPRELEGTSLTVFLTVDAADEAAFHVMRAPKTGTIDKFLWFTPLVSTGATLDGRIESVGAATGDPSGTLLGANSNGSHVLGGGDSGTWRTVTLTTGVAVTQGDPIAVGIVNPSSSFGNFRITGHSYSDQAFPYADLFTGSWTKQNQGPAIALEYDDGTYAWAPGSRPVAMSTKTYNSSSSPDEWGILINVPVPLRVGGGWLFGDLDNANDIILYSAADAELLSISHDPDFRRNTSTKLVDFMFADTVDLAADTDYRLVLKPTTTSNVSIGQQTVDSAAAMNALAGGTGIIGTERVNAGAWTDTATERQLIGLYVTGVDNGAGGAGGMIVHPGMTGGMHG